MKAKRTLFTAIVFGLFAMVMFISCEPYLNPPPLKVVSITPSNKAVNISVTVNVVIKFDRNVNIETLEGGIRLYKENGTEIPIDVSWNEDVIDFYPTGSNYPYLPGTKYIIKIYSSLESDEGGEAEPATFYFTTED